MKKLALYKYLIKRYLFYLLIFSSIFGVTNLILNQMSIFSVLHITSYYLYGYTVVLVSLNYYLFKLAIVSGISRTKLYRLKLLLLFTIALILNTLIFSVNLIFYVLQNGHVASIYISLYFGFFNNYILNIVSMFVVGFVAIFFIMILFNTFGTLLSLFNFIGKVITFVGIYGCWVLIFSSIGAYSEFLNGGHNLQKIFNLLMGLNASTAGNGNNGNPLNIAITLILFTSLLLFVNYKLTKKFQIRK